MKVQIRDRDALESLSTTKVRAYLESHGWTDTRPWGKWAIIHSKERNGKLWEISVPLRDGGATYAEFMAMAVTTLAEAEDRSQLDVYYDLANPRIGTVPQGNRKGDNEMTSVWCVRAEFGRYTPQFVSGGYAGIGWIPQQDLTAVKRREDLYPLYEEAHPNDTSKFVIGQQVGQIARFLLEIEIGDYVITPTDKTASVRYGRVTSDPNYTESPTDGCPFPHRRKIDWAEQPLNRQALSVPFQKALGSSLTVFAVRHHEEFLSAIGEATKPNIPQYDPYRVVLERVLELDDKEFEVLASHLLTALGFDDPEVTGKPGDGGVDVRGQLNVSNLATVELFVQVKRYKLGTRINSNTVRQLRQSIPLNGQGAFISTAGYQKAAFDVASEPGFPRIGLINGNQLVDLLVEHWATIPIEFQERLGLKTWLVPA